MHRNAYPLVFPRCIHCLMEKIFSALLCAALICVYCNGVRRATTLLLKVECVFSLCICYKSRVHCHVQRWLQGGRKVAWRVPSFEVYCGNKVQTPFMTFPTPRGLVTDQLCTTTTCGFIYVKYQNTCGGSCIKNED